MLVTLKNEYLSVVISTKAAEFQSIKKDGLEYLWQGDPNYWTDHSPILFPFVGRFTQGKYILNGKEYPMTIHGFASAKEFDVIAQSETSVTFFLTDTPDTYEIYPFHFELRITYSLNEDTISIRYQVANLSDETMYFGIGGHPGFRVPLEEDLDFSDYYLEFGQAHTPTRVGHTPTCFLSNIDTDFPLINGTVLPLKHDMFDDDAIVLKNVADSVTLQSDKSSHSVTVSYPHLPYLGLWHAPKTDAPYICIEPWSSLPSRQDVIEDFRFKSDMIRLDASCNYDNNWSIQLK